MAWDGVRAAKSAYESDLFARANVVGLGVGNKVTRGEPTDERCVVVFVERKIRAEELRIRDLVPRDLEGVPTDVVETGRFVALSMAEATEVRRTDRIRPAPGGVSIGHSLITAGTLGVLAHRRTGEAVILSNNHVLANSNAAVPGDLILQPGPADGGRMPDAIATLVTFVPISFKDRELSTLGRLLDRITRPLLARLGLGLRRLPTNTRNRVDAAIAAPLANDLVAPGILDIGAVRGTATAEIGLRIRKSGRTTGLTTGKITALDAVLEVDYVGKTAVFREQLVGDIRSRGGDSGSLIVDDAGRAVGLLFAGGSNTTVFNPIDAVLQALDLTL
jgi:hypothetical protein